MAESAAPDVRVKLSAEGVEEVVRAFQQVAASAKKAGKDGASGLGELRKSLESIGSLLPALGFGAAIAGVGLLVKNALNTADAIGKLSQKTGVSTQTLSALRVAATLTDVEFEALGKGLVKFDKTMGSLDEGVNTAGAAVRRLFGSATALSGLDTDQRLEKVVTALAHMADGSAKAKAAIDFFGKAGAELIPLINSLGEGGFAKMRQRAEEFGLALDAKTTAAAMRAKESMKLLGLEVQGVATQFVAGMAPQVETAMEIVSQAISTDGTNAFKEMGEVAGRTLGAIVLAFKTLGGVAGGILYTLWESGKDLFESLKSGVEELVEHAKGYGAALKALVHGDLDGAKAAIASANSAVDRMDAEEEARHKQHIDNIKGYWKNLATDLSETFSKVFLQEPPEPKVPKPKTGGGAGEQDAAAARARLEAAQAHLDDLLTVFKAHNATLLQENENQYKQGLKSLSDYFARRRELVQAELDKEIATLQGKRDLVAKAPTDTKAEAIKQTAEVEKLNAEIAAKQEERKKALGDLDEQESERKQALHKEDLKIEDEVQAAQGNTLRAALAGIEEERVALVQSGISKARAQELADTKTAQATFKDTEQKGSLAFEGLADVQSGLKNQVDAGQLFPAEALDRYRAAVEGALPHLRDLATTMKATAVGPQAAQAAEQFRLRVEALGISVDEAAQRLAKFKEGVQSSLTSDLTRFFDSGIEKARGFGDAMRELAVSVLTSLQQIVAQMVATLAVQKLLSALGGIGGGAQPTAGQQVSTAAAAGAAQATPIAAASVALSAAGTQLLAAGSGLAGASTGMLTGAAAVKFAAMQLQEAADTMLYANAGGSLLGFAEGGMVSGPGTSTSDSIPARLSAGEFVVRAHAVRQPGVLPLLATINRGVGTPALRGPGIPRFASGGLVTAADAFDPGGAGGGDVHLHVGIEEGVFVRRVHNAMRTREGQRVQIETLQANPKSAAQALGR